MPVSPYLASVRRRVGTDLIIVPSAVALITDEQQRLLMVELAGQRRWGLPGGAIEPDEQPAAAVVRETHEETGLTIAVDGIHDVYGGPQMRHTFPNGDQIQYTMIAYWCSIIDGAPRADNDEIVDAQFVDRDQLDAIELPAWGRIVVPDVFAAIQTAAR